MPGTLGNGVWNQMQKRQVAQLQFKDLFDGKPTERIKAGEGGSKSRISPKRANKVQNGTGKIQNQNQGTEK